ncbi:MAG: ABC transporter permease subunit [Treponema sp.]|nr:ABC transporter permease subunit [Treponema sp.]
MAALIINAPLILPKPLAVVKRLWILLQVKTFWLSFAFTILRVFLAYMLTLILGFFLGLLSVDFPGLDPFISLPISIIRSTPVIALILLALFWFNSSSLPIFVSLLMTLPVMTAASKKGFEKNSENEKVLFMAKCYSFTGWKAFRYIRFPKALPHLLSASEAVFGMSWKVVAAGEVLSIPKYGAGALLQKAQVHLESSELLAVTIMLVLISLIFEKILKIINSSKIRKIEL